MIRHLQTVIVFTFIVKRFCFQQPVISLIATLNSIFTLFKITLFMREKKFYI